MKIEKLKSLPIGRQTFSELRLANELYVDKTAIALDLIERYRYVFLSRPRRFGKSLFLSTLKEIFEGNSELFKGLDIYDKWDWADTYPVIKIDWSGDFRTLKKTEERILAILEENQKRLGVQCDFHYNLSNCFEELIQNAYEKYQKPVVVLIDEYDKPILDNLDQIEIAKENRELIKALYGMMKANDAYIKFVFLTGVSKFSKASIFSGLNMLEDISLTPAFGNICGYTQKDIESIFLPYLEGVDLEKLKAWYNGYNFLNDKVYNPFDILLFIKNSFLYDNYWFSTGTPSFLIKLFHQQHYNLAQFENIEVGKELVESFDIEDIKFETIMFQAGYLTIAEMIQKRNKIRYRLTYPNLETKMSFNDYLLNSFVRPNYQKNQIQDQLIEVMELSKLSELKSIFKSLFASIAYNNFTTNTIQNYEGFYASVVYAYFAGAGFDRIIAEDVTNDGRIDLTVFIDEKVYIFEFKVNGSDALEQIKEKQYHLKYMSRYPEIYLLGITFDKAQRNISEFVWEKVQR